MLFHSFPHTRPADKHVNILPSVTYPLNPWDMAQQLAVQTLSEATKCQLQMLWDIHCKPLWQEQK